MYDECIESKGESNGIEIKGRHCMYEVDPMIDGNNLPYGPTMSVCLPASCNADDVVALAKVTINATDELRGPGVNIASATCTASGNIKNWNLGLSICVATVGIYIAFLIFCTIYDLTGRGYDFQKGNGAGNYEFYQKFSLATSAQAIISTKISENDLPVIHGIRALSTLWIVRFHEYYTPIFGVNMNLLDITKWLSSWRYVDILMSSFSVDTFFVLSGFLMTFTFFKKIQKEKNFNLLHYYSHRYMRLTPPMAILVLISTTIFPSLASGARWEWMQNFLVTGCRTKWWSILLYVMNFVDQNSHCLLHLWSNCVDMQLYWISPLILIPLYRKPKLGLIILGTLLAFSIVSTGWIVGSNGYLATYASYEPNITMTRDAFFSVYVMPHTRAAPWLFGILLGYEVFNKNFEITKEIAMAGWLLILGSLTMFMIFTSLMIDQNYKSNIFVETIAASIMRPVWAVSMCWLILTSLHNWSGPISSILSWKYFLPISRLSYCIFLTHICIPMIRHGTLRSASYFHDYPIFHAYVGDMVLATIIAFFFSIFFERPFLVFESLISKNRARSARSSSKQQKID
ncbi:hypothetical protein QAD02_009945 [Eretmocerus hayati]|uniref:Uncharacterized protein n=1 Tax=Eretmocerus hayati TaxID=131215 RepID=A0ACC2NAU0_9HYME|nr:hypothetical protein QAD02_009945 [Eretmocerus hayati]